MYVRIKSNVLGPYGGNIYYHKISYLIFTKIIFFA